MAQQTYKIAIVGDGGVGKSSLLDAKINRNFETNRKLTVGVDFELVPVEKAESEEGNSQFLVMDLGGQVRFHFMHDAYIRGIKGAIIMFDMSRFPTFQHLDQWITLIQNENPDIPVLVVGNKCDIIDADKQLQFDADLRALMENYAGRCNIHGYLFTSAKDLINVDDVFAVCEEMILQKVGTCVEPTNGVLSQ